jgi:hypothetical protein
VREKTFDHCTADAGDAKESAALVDDIIKRIPNAYSDLFDARRVFMLYLCIFIATVFYFPGFDVA